MLEKMFTWFLVQEEIPAPVEAVEPDPKQLRLRHLLMKQIKLSRLVLRSTAEQVSTKKKKKRR